MALSAQGLKARNRLWPGAAKYGSIRIVIKPHLSTKRSIHDSRGLTLAEVMVATIVLAFASLGLVKVTYQLRVTAEDSIHQSTALVMAQGYMEQLCKLPYSAPNPPPYNQYANPPGLVQIADAAAPMELTNNSSATLTGITITNGQTMIFGTITNPDGTTATQGNPPIYIDEDGTGAATYPMNFSFTPTLTDLSVATGGNAAHTTVGTADGMEIVITFTESYTLAGNTRVFKSSVRSVYGNVATQ
jgi:Tfp pilus assembly protein PilV